MGRRTKRYLHHQVKANLPEFDQKEIQLICWDGRTLCGTASASGERGLVVIDKNVAWYNRKDHTHFVELSEIKEVVIDEISSW